MSLPHKLEVISPDLFPQIHESSLKILKETGVRFHHDEALSLFKKHGAEVDGHIVRFPKNLVEEKLKTVPSTFRWRARNDRHSVVVGDGFLVQPIAGPVHIQDLDRGRRKGTLEDIANMQKIYQSEEVYDLVGMIACEPSDIRQEEKHLYLMYEILRNTDKPVNGFMTYGHHARAQLDMMEIAMGGKQILQNNHCIAVSISATTPLTYTQEALETLFQYVKRNQIATIISLATAGTTAPLSLLGSVVVQNAEMLAGIVLTQLINPGNPAVYCPSATTANLMTGDYTTGTPEGMLINIGNLQIALDYYRFPTRSMPGCTDSKAVDYQAGYETMQNLMMGMLSGSHILNESVGVLDNILTCSYEKTIIDGELIARIKRIWEGIEGSDKDLSVDLIQEIGPGGTYLTHPVTLEHCRERWFPKISYWGAYEDWVQAGSEDVALRANKKYKQILRDAPPSLIDDALDRELKAYMDSELKKIRSGTL